MTSLQVKLLTMNKKHFLMAALSFMLLLPSLSKAQESDLGNWLIYIGSKKLEGKWNLHNEIQYRNYDAVGDLEQLLLRNYAPNGLDKITVNEHRIFQQFTSKQKVGKLSLTHRYRFEQRFVEDDFKARFRYFLAFKLPFKGTEEALSKYYLSAYNEIFLNTKSSFFDRNRVYGGLGYQLNKTVHLEVGYMNQFFESGGRDQINLITFVNF
jgi:hypothetical protein